MARVRTVDFLPEIFQTSTNRQVLGATLDQLVQEPQFKKTQGFVGRRVGPGVNANDRYVVEPTTSRTDYQLEPGVIIKKPDSDTIEDVITYPGINDAIKTQGGITTDANALYTSEFYTWDPLIDFDKFVNSSQYYWLPLGPDPVLVSSGIVPVEAEYTVTRSNGVYTFSGYKGDDPALTLVRGGSYKFNIAQNFTEEVTLRVTNDRTSAYVINYQANPSVTLVRGNTYVFNLNFDIPTFPFWIKTQATLGTGEQYNNGVLRNGATTGIITFTVPQDAPDTLYYSCEDQFNMRGTFNIVDAIPGEGPGFWIQAAPGVNGRMPSTPNISSRDVLGVINNGTDLGQVQFNVPYSTAQNFYYTLNPITNPFGNGQVDLLTTLNFDQINNVFLDNFLQQYGGIDGISNLDGRTVVFINNTTDAESGGWYNNSQFDPLLELPANNGLAGSFDSTTFDQTTEVPQNQWYSVWQIQYVPTQGGGTYLKLNSVSSINNLEKFTVTFGTQYANTQWYKSAEGQMEQIPLLTAVQDTLYYQDGLDAGIFGAIRLIEQTDSATINVDEDIVGRKNYTSPSGVVFTNGLKVQFDSTVLPSSYQNNFYYVEGVGTAIKLLPVTNFITPESYTRNASVPYDSVGFDIGGYDATLNAPLLPDYLTINRASPDLNAWTRSNRWFHIDVINATAEYNNTTPVLDNNFRAKRPIIEFQAGTRLFNFGTSGKQPVDTIDFTQTDAFSNVEGTVGYSVNGYTLVEGSRIIFASDTDPQVRNKIYTVQFIQPDTVAPIIPQPIINLIPTSDTQAQFDQTIVCLSGTQAGNSYWFDGVTWIKAQDKTEINQPPLFNVYDADGISFADPVKYFSGTFAGSKLFSYAVGTGSADNILGFPLRYLSLSNVGDIVFDNNLYTDTFTYVSNNQGVTQNISEGFVRKYADRTEYTREIGWQTAVTPTQSYQQFQFSYNGSPLKLDVKVSPTGAVPSVKIFIANSFVPASDYTVLTTNTTTTITLNKIYTPGDVIEVDVLSDQISATAFYQVPSNLENNPFNINSPTFTLGTVRSHYETIGENLLGLVGPINGANNSRDLGNIGIYGTQIVQQSSPLTLAGYFMRSEKYDIFASLEYNDREYTKFKDKLLNAVVQGEWGNYSPSQILDAIVTDLSVGKSDTSPFYWSDMLPAGNNYTENSYTVSAITTGTFSTVQTYDFDTANFKGLLIFLTQTINGEKVTRLLTNTVDYTVATDGPRVTIATPLYVGNVVTIREYSNTAGNYVPNTPTKLGLYGAWIPEIYYDTNYVKPTNVIRGHDGSITVAFGDIRDQVLLEFERRVFNNLKTWNNPVPLVAEDVVPGYFRTTDYSAADTTGILGESFLTWVGWNKIDYKNQYYIADNEFTYNYSQAGNKQTNQPLLGAWRGISRNFYDTLSPNYTPWEMLGFAIKPTWWESEYGPAPYTDNNLVLWDDISAGIIKDPAGTYIDPKYIRNGLSSYFIPTGSEGELLSPLNSVVGPYDPTGFKKSWVVGDGGPAEAAWWMSSSYPFAVMRLLALTRPAEFFSLFADRDLYRYDADIGQYLYNKRYRLDANGIEVYGNGVSKASYINWIVDYNQQLGINSTTALESDLASLDVRLCWRMASFSDKQYTKVFVERSSPDSQNTSLQIPDQSYNLFLYKNVPVDTVNYSSVIVQQVENGYAVYGYGTTDPYFNILASQTNGNFQVVQGGNTTVRVPRDYTNNVVKVPYGYVFANQTIVVDFLLSYGKYLEARGFSFDNYENGYVLNWEQMAREFLYWSNQGWGTGSLMNLNPVAGRLVVTRPGTVVDSLVTQTPESQVLDQNRTPIDSNNFVVERLENTFSIASANQTISYAKLKFVSYEDILVLDNQSIFGDLIYNPITGARQNRVGVVANITTEWNGTLDAQGFILNQDTVPEWKSNTKYAKGEIVTYKNTYWSAQTIVQPKVEFDYQDWVKSDWTKIQRGLLPNIANKANQLANSYNTQVANLEVDNDLLSYGLIGFKPRQYMVDLNLSDSSQVQLYQQFIGTKGTIRAAEIFSGADLNKEVADYQIYENWAVRRGIYGANANNNSVELRLNEADLTSDPGTIQVVASGESSTANQEILLTDVWKTSRKLNSTDILPTTVASITDTILPTAGYVDLNDVDITVFSLDDPTVINQRIDDIGIGTKIWVAKSNAYDWNVYRCTEVPGYITSVSDNLDGTSLVTFTGPHNLKRGDLLIIRYFNTSINGVYRLLSTPDIQTATIAYTFTGNATSVTGTGLGFFLQTMRVAQPSDIANLPYVNDLIPGAMAWVDDNGQGLWEVLEKQQVFTSINTVNPTANVANSEFGTSIAQGEDKLSVLVGAPNYGSSGGVYTYLRGQDGYVENPVLTLTTPNTERFGQAVDIGYQSWGVIGAPASDTNVGYASSVYRNAGTNLFDQTQLFVPPDQDFAQGEFGSSVVISQDERWMYIGAPGTNAVYAYGRQDVEPQYAEYLSDGVNDTYSFDGLVYIDNPNQLVVIVNNVIQTYNTDYTVSGTDVITSGTLVEGQVVRILRKEVQQLDHQVYYNRTPNSKTGPGINATFTIDRTRGVYTPTLANAGTGYSVGNTLTYYGTTLGGGTNPANNLVITVTAVSGTGAITAFSKSGSGVNNTSSFNITNYLYPVTDIFSFTIIVNDAPQRPFIDYTYAAGSITFVNNPPAGATIIARAGTAWKYVQRLDVAGIPADANFGSSVTTLYTGRQVIIGADNDTNNGLKSGSAYVFDRCVTNYIVDSNLTSTYTLTSGYQGPINVVLNNTYLKPQFIIKNGTTKYQFVNGQYAVNLDSGTVTIFADLAVGDVLEIETNQFTYAQKLIANAQFDEAQFGFAVDMCLDNDEVYIGAPRDGTDMISAGSVERFVNQSYEYGVITGTVQNPTLTVGHTIRINNQPVAVPLDNTVAGLALAINSSGIPNVVATVSNGYLTLSIINRNAVEEEGNPLIVQPGLTGTAYSDIGFEMYVFTQTITSPNPVINAQFGYSLCIENEANNLVIGAPGGNTYEPVTFDNGTCYFDDRSTTFYTLLVQSGAVYTFDYLPSGKDSITDPGKFIFGQQVYDSQLAELDQFGIAVNYTSDQLIVGSPGSPAGTDAYGRMAIFNNPNDAPSWAVKHIQLPVVDTQLINGVYMYNKLSSDVTSYLDFFNPLQGKILGVADENIDYTGAVDPANYNTGTIHNYGNSWGAEHVGEIWWDTNLVRFIDPNQDDITYASRRWGQVFPGSRIDIYQWIESDVTPINYTGPGTPLSVVSYSTRTQLNSSNIFATKYYFWVRNISTVNTVVGKKLSTTAIASYIENPRGSGIPYLALLDSNTVAIYNCQDLLSAADTILHIDYDLEYTEANTHYEYELIAEGKADSFLSSNLYLKLVDSFSGVNSVGLSVPDNSLPIAERYGVNFRPRQSMFANRFGALENYLGRANTVLSAYPISETRSFNLLNSSEPKPTSSSGAWNKQVANLEELSYQNLAVVPYGYKYLVDSDSNNNGLWTIYEVIAGTQIDSKELTLVRVQSYYTPAYWQYINWYQPGYNSATNPVAQVAVYSELATLTVPVGSSVKVTSNSQGKWEIYQKTDTGWDRVGLELGTIEFKNDLWSYAAGKFGFDSEVFDVQYFDQEPVTETRKIIEAINEELFVGELAIERNNSLVLMFNYILGEFTAPDWLFKTSLIDVDHTIRQLIPYQIYRQDNQDFVLQYIQEVKPYHVQIREFNLIYNGSDMFAGTLTDFDIPAFWDSSLLIPQFISPVLLPYTHSTANSGWNPYADYTAGSTLWSKLPWNQWFENYHLSPESVIILDSGSGYVDAPVVTFGTEWSANTIYTIGQQIYYGNNLYTVNVAGTSNTIAPEFTTGTQECGTYLELTYVGTPMKGYARLNSAGGVALVIITDTGSGYVTIPPVVFSGSAENTARATVLMSNPLVRSIRTTIKYDRYEYSSNIVEWQANTTYTQGTQVRFDNRVWQANETVTTSIFELDQWTEIPASNLSGVDRTMGYYVSTANTPGLSLPLLIDGIDYPGVQVYGPDYNANPGFDLAPYDSLPFDNIVIGPDGRPTYDDSILDAIYESNYLDTYLGTRPTDINVEGGAYVDTYSSHAPEELVPGAEFDTLDLRVYTTPGADWQGLGHGLPMGSTRAVWTAENPVISFAGIIDYPVVQVAFNVTTGYALFITPEYVDWVNYTITFVPEMGISEGDIIDITVVGVGGGNQLGNYTYVGNEVNAGIVLPFSQSMIYEIVAYNGEFQLDSSDYTLTPLTSLSCLLTFANTYTSSERINFTVLGYATDGTTHSWSLPVVQDVLYDGNPITLTDSLQGTNIPNLVVLCNGVRLKPYEGARHVSDGSTVTYNLPWDGSYSQSLVADNDVLVYNNQQALELGIDYVVDAYDGSSLRTVTLFNPPSAGSAILISVRTNAQYIIQGNDLIFQSTPGLNPQIDDLISIISWNDLSEQGLLTQVWVGPVTQGSVLVNVFDTGRNIDVGERILVTLDQGAGGKFLFENYGYTIDGSKVIITGAPIDATDVVTITSFTQSVVPGAMEFRLFQDMRGVQATYRMTPQTTTFLTGVLLATDDVIYVDDANKLSEPNLVDNVWGVITINGERIMYRERDTVNNTVSSLLRGTAGTGAADHVLNSIVYDMGRGNLMPEQFQNYIVSNNILADGSTSVFIASDIDLTLEDSTIRDESVEVYVGGTLQVGNYTVINDNPAMILFNEPPADGVEVTILVRRGVTWYNPGPSTPSDGVPLQQTQNDAAKFLRGLN